MASATTAIPVPRRSQAAARIGIGVPVLALGALVATAATLALTDDGESAATPTVSAIAQSADAAERWLAADSASVDVRSADAAERWAIGVEVGPVERCADGLGSPDAVERCALGG